VHFERVQGFLSKQERPDLKRELGLERTARWSDRIKCILLLDAGEPVDKIAKYVFLSRGSIYNYYKKYAEGGI